MSCPKKYIQEAVTDSIERDRLNNLHDSIGQEALDTNNFRRINDTIAVISKKYAQATQFLKDSKEKYGQGVVRFARQGSKTLLEVNVLKTRKESTQSTLFQKDSPEGIISSEKTIRDLAERMSDRIGIPYKIISDRSQEFKGMLKNGVAIINLAYATLDTPIHEIIGHSFIRALKNNLKEKDFYLKDGTKSKSGTYDKDGNLVLRTIDKIGEKSDNNYEPNVLYQNLLKELEYGRGKEVLDRVKRNYNSKDTYDSSNSTFPEINNYGISLERFIEAGINNGKSAFAIKQDLERHFLKVDGEWCYFNYTYGENWSPEFPGDENPYKPITTLEEVNELIGKKVSTPYTLEEQQEEAIVQLLGEYTAEKLDKVKDGKLISLLKRVLGEIRDFVRKLLLSREINVENLPENITLGELSDLLAYSNSKIILPGYGVQYTTPDNSKFTTYSQALKHIGELTKNSIEPDLNKNLSVDDIDKEIEILQKQLDNFKFETEPFNKFIDVYTNKGRLRQNHWTIRPDGTKMWAGISKETLIEPEYDGFVLDIDRGDGRFITKISDEEAKKLYYSEENILSTQTKENRNKYAELEKKIHELKNNSLKGFIQRNKEYEQSKEIIEEWKKVNGIEYDPEEIYSRGQGFYSVVGAYSDFDVNLMFQNILHHIEDNQKAGGEFTISAFTKPIDRKIVHLENGSTIKFVIYPKSQDIKWAANTDAYSGSVWDAAHKTNKSKQSELLGVSYTKYPSLNNINSVQPNLVDIVDNLSHHHNELGISLNNNFRLEYDDTVPYQTKKLIDNINKILDQKFGKLEKPTIERKVLKSEKVYEVRWKQSGNVIARYTDLEKAKEAADQDAIEVVEGRPIEQIGKQPQKTNKNLEIKILDVKSQLNDGTFGIKSLLGRLKFEQNKMKILQGIIDANVDTKEKIQEAKKQIEATEKETNRLKELINNPPKKEYSSQALINSKISALKEVSKKYPASLIRSEVVKEKQYEDFGEALFQDDELPFQKLSKTEEDKSIDLLTKALEIDDDILQEKMKNCL